MKILIILGGFFPGKNYGGPPVSVSNFCSLMGDDANCYIVTCNHDMNDSTPYNTIQDGWNLRENAKVLYLPDEEYSYLTFERVIKSIRPDYIYLQGLFQSCVFPCLKLAKKHKIGVVLAPRGELCAGAFKKKYKKIPYIYMLRLMGLLKDIHYQSTSDEETEAIGIILRAPKSKIHQLSNIPSVPKTLTSKTNKLKGEGHFVFISRIVEKKNLLKAITFFKNIQGSAFYDIYGPIEDSSYWQECEKIISNLPTNIRVAYKGVLQHNQIHDIFSQYDAFLFPTLSENYGHVIAEALYSGCIPIISDQTPWTDIYEAQAGFAYSLNDSSSFSNAIQSIINMDNEAIGEMKHNIQRYLKQKQDLTQLKEKYLQLFAKY